MRTQNQLAISAMPEYSHNKQVGYSHSSTSATLAADANPLLWSLSSTEERQQLVANQQFEDLISSRLGSIAQNEDSFSKLLKESFGVQIDSQATKELRNTILDGNRQSLPQVKVVDAEQLNGALGAYSISNDTIYLSSDIAGTEVGNQTLIEEFGHAIDARLNSTDSLGDEGERFRRILNGESISVDQNYHIEVDNDHGTITIEGQKVAVEFRQEGGYTGSDYPWNPGGVASGSANRSSTMTTRADSSSSGGYTGSDYPWNPGGVASGSANRSSTMTTRADSSSSGGYTATDYPWNPGGVASGSANRSSTTTTRADSSSSGGYTGADYPWNPGGVASGSANQISPNSDSGLPASIRLIEQRAQDSSERAQSLADDIDKLGTSGGYVLNALRVELLDELIVVEGGNRETALQVRTFMEQGHSLDDARLRARVVEDVANEPIDGGFGAAGIGPNLPRFSNIIDGAHGTSAEAALAILNDMNDGKPPFRPELGQRGPVQWFVTEGDPRTGRAAAEITIPAEIQVPRGASIMEFNDTQLKEIFDDLLIEAREVAKEQYAQQYPARDLNSRRSLEQIEFRARGLAEGNMWSEVGERVAASDSGIGRVVQSTDSMFSSGRSGTFMLTSNPELATVRGGPGALLDIIQSKGVRAEPAIVEAAEKASRSGAITGNIDGVFRVGGRVLIVAGLAADGYRIYQADDRIRETVIVGGGWAGATGAMATYNAVTGPSNAGGPWFWAGNLVGNIAVGIGGYYAGEQIAELVYDLAIDPKPIEVPSE